MVWPVSFARAERLQCFCVRRDRATRRKVTAGRRVYLWLGATDGSAKVFVNGRHVPYVSADGKRADEAGGFIQPASFDVTGMIRAGDVNQLTVFCERRDLNELGTGGLMGPVVVYCER